MGNLLYYLCLAAAIQRAGAPLPTMIIGTLPVVIAVVSNRRDAQRDGRLPWRRLAPSLVLICIGIALVNQVEVAALRADEDPDRLSFLHAVRVVRRKLPLFAALSPSAQARPA